MYKPLVLNITDNRRELWPISGICPYNKCSLGLLQKMCYFSRAYLPREGEQGCSSPSAPQPACKMSLFPTSYASLLIAASSALPPVVEARPYLLLNNPRPKCIEVTATEGTSVVVRYEAPDLVALDGLDEDGTSDRINADITTTNLGPDEARKDAANKDRGGSGLDQQWNKRAHEAKRAQLKQPIWESR